MWTHGNKAIRHFRSLQAQFQVNENRDVLSPDILGIGGRGCFANFTVA
jgi:hypothetical protein